MQKNEFNNANPEKIHKYQKEIDEIDKELSEIENAMEGIIDTYSESKSAVRLELARNFADAQSKTKKSAGIEVLELYIISKNPELENDYKDYIFYETKKELLSKIMESKKSRIIGKTANMKYDDWIK